MLASLRTEGASIEVHRMCNVLQSLLRAKQPHKTVRYQLFIIVLWKKPGYRASLAFGIWVCKLQDRREITLKLQEIIDRKFQFWSKAIMSFGELHLVNLNNN